jgi:hypothetical protein
MRVARRQLTGREEARSKVLEVRHRSAEAKTEYDSTRENYRRPDMQDADNREGIGIQKELNM